MYSSASQEKSPCNFFGCYCCICLWFAWKTLLCLEPLVLSWHCKHLLVCIALSKKSANVCTYVGIQSKAKQSTGSRCNLLATKAIKTMFFSAPFATASNLQEALASQLCADVTLMTSDCIRPNMLDNYSKTP